MVPYTSRSRGSVEENKKVRLVKTSVLFGKVKVMSEINNDVASEYEMPREPKFYENSSLPKTDCNITMPNVRQPIGSGDRICDTCIKEDVCMYKAELAQAAKEIIQISERTNVFIDTDIRCKKWSEKISIPRKLDITYMGEKV